MFFEKNFLGREISDNNRKKKQELSAARKLIAEQKSENQV